MDVSRTTFVRMALQILRELMSIPTRQTTESTSQRVFLSPSGHLQAEEKPKYITYFLVCFVVIDIIAFVTTKVTTIKQSNKEFVVGYFCLFNDLQHHIFLRFDVPDGVF